VAGYAVHGNYQTFIWGIWPALLGPMVSLLLTVLVSRATPPPPDEVVELFFGG
jgi:hypothetical protein